MNSPTEKLINAILEAVHEYQKSFISEKVKTEMKKAKEQGKEVFAKRKS